jgi:2-methylcitrate synthase/citrate synthase II
MAGMTEDIYRPGLEGVIAGESAVSTVLQDSLAYRGYRIEELGDHSDFAEVAWLLPTKGELDGFTRQLDSYRKLPGAVVDCIRAIPKATPMMDVLRTASSMAGHFDPTRGDGHDGLLDRATFMLAIMPGIIAARLRLLGGKDPVEPKRGLTHARQLLYQCFGEEPSDLHAKLMNLTLILYAEHGFNASTFAARVCTSTLSDMCSAVVTGIGTLKGPLHGGANEEAMKLIKQFRTADEARKWTEEAIERKVKIMGFGHRVYRNGDHRSRILEAYLPELANQRGEEWRVEVYHAIKNTVWERKQIHPNVDYPCGLTYFFMGLPLDIYTPIFVASRTSGWCAHIIEQYLANRLIRPRAKYTGPELRDYVPIEKR